MKAHDLMTSPVVTASEDATLEDIARLMIDRRIGGVPIVDAEGRIVGIITKTDFGAKEGHVPFSLFRAPQVFGRWLDKQGLQRIYEEARSMKARDVMTRNVVTASEDDEIEKVVRHMFERDVSRVPIVRERKPVGIVARHDLLRVMMGDQDARA